MTLTELHTSLSAALASYAAGGAEWEIPSGVQQATQYSAMEDFNSDGIIVYAWLGAAESGDHADSPATCDLETMLYARAKIIGDSTTLAQRSAMLTDDLIRMLLSMNGTTSATVNFHSAEESLITGNSADVLVRATCHSIWSAS
jgi:hypothetical protein